MACFHPLTAYRSLCRKTDNGKALIVFSPELAGHAYETIQLPCGQCIGCRISRSKAWALRCVHEASLFNFNCFLTLTFDDQHIDINGSLVKKDFQNFMKRLRKEYQGFDYVKNDKGVLHKPIRFFHCGEYGDRFDRAHHHACIFNFDFLDKQLFATRDGVKLYRSASLESLWENGFSLVGDVTYQSAAYVARYITKKINGERAAVHYARIDQDSGEMTYIEPEYITMSRRPGIGKVWFDKFGRDVYPKDFCTYEGKKFKPPSYYDKIYDSCCPEGMAYIKTSRLARAKEHLDNNTPARLGVREKVLKVKCKQLVRGYEHES